MGNCSEEKPRSCIPANTVYGPYMIYPDATIIDIGKKKKIKKVLRNGKYYVGLRLHNEENLRYTGSYMKHLWTLRSERRITLFRQMGIIKIWIFQI